MLTRRPALGLLMALCLLNAASCHDGGYVSQVNSANFNNSQGSPAVTFCESLQGRFRFGVSSYGGLREWAVSSIAEEGTPFDYLYIYILAPGMENADDFRDWYILPFIQACEETGATPLFSFYQLLDLGYARGFSGSEPEVVRACLESAGCMRTYFDNFVWFLSLLAEHAPHAVIDVEPDSWGFMMWAMGTEGNDDATTVEVKVDQSGHPDVAGFPNNAGGFGKALLALRNQYAPQVHMGWHSSNFRAGTRPEVVTGFYGAMGNWDLLVCENFHMEADVGTWWEPWDEDRVESNLNWAHHVTSTTGLPMLLWQIPIGSWDYHLLGDGTYTMLERLINAGVTALLFDHQNHQGADNPDDYRAEGAFGTVPPADSDAGGTAGDMRERVTLWGTQPDQSFTPACTP